MPPLLCSSDEDESDDQSSTKGTASIASDEFQRDCHVHLPTSWPPPDSRSPSPAPRAKPKKKQQHRPDGTSDEEEKDSPPDYIFGALSRRDGHKIVNLRMMIDGGTARDLIAQSVADTIAIKAGPTEAGSLKPFGECAGTVGVPIVRTSDKILLYVGDQKLLIRPLIVPDIGGEDMLIGRNTRNALGISTGPLATRFPDELAAPPPADFVDLDLPNPRLKDGRNLPPEEEKQRLDLRAETKLWLQEHLELTRLDEFIRLPRDFTKKTGLLHELHVFHEPNTPPAYVHQYRSKPHLHPYITAQVNLWDECKKVRLFDVSKDGPIPLYNMPLHPAVTYEDYSDVEKKVRVCVDARKLNIGIVNDNYPLPPINDIYQALAGMKYFGELDLTSAFLQFPVAEESQRKLAFTWNGKVYVFTGAIFGVKHVSSHVQRVMIMIFRDMPFVIIYVDNIIIYSKTLEEHRDHVRLVIDRCTEFNIILTPGKCQFACTEIVTLGNVVTSEGTRADPKKVNSIMSWPTPTEAEQLQRFLGVANFLREYVRNYSMVAAPLYALLPATNTVKGKKKEKVPFIWTDEHRRHFDTLKHAIATSPMKNFIDFTKAFSVTVDSSRYGIGAVLYQPKEPHDLPNAENIVTFASRTLRDYEKNYEVYKLELNAIIFAFREFDDALSGNHFTLFTDHHALIYLHTQKDMNRTLSNWFHHICGYDFDVRHLPGHINCFSDWLSRMFQTKGPWGVSPMEPEAKSKKSSPATTAISTPTAMAAPAVDSARDDEIVRATHVSDGNTSDDDNLPSQPWHSLLATLNSAERGEKTARVIVRAIRRVKAAAEREAANPRRCVTFDPELGPDTDTFNPSEVDHRIPAFHPDPLAIPSKPISPATEEEQMQLVESVHLEGDFGYKAIVDKLKRRGYKWHGMTTMAQIATQNCTQCQNWTQVKRVYKPLGSSIRSLLPWQNLQMDISTHYKSAQGYNYVLAVIDIFSGFCLLRPLVDRSAEEVAEPLWKIFADFGPPRSIQSDNDTSFLNDIVQTMIKAYGTVHRTIPAYSPQIMGKVERLNKTVSEGLHKLMDRTGLEWPSLLPSFQLYLNEKVKRDFNTTPFALMFNRDAELWQPYTADDYINGPAQFDDYVQAAQRRQYLESQVFPVIATRNAKVAHQRARHFDSRHQTDPKLLPIGALVMVEPDVRGSKNNQRYEGQPRKVIYVTPQHLYVTQGPTGDISRPLSRHQLKHIKFPRQKKEDDTYEVEAITDYKLIDGVPHYLIAWKGYTDQDWIPMTNLDSPRLVLEFWQKRSLPGPPATSSPPTSQRAAAAGDAPTSSSRDKTKRKPRTSKRATTPPVPSPAVDLPSLPSTSANPTPLSDSFFDISDTEQNVALACAQTDKNARPPPTATEHAATATTRDTTQRRTSPRRAASRASPQKL